MNFSVIRSADTIWGHTFAMQLARQKRHLLLLGKDLSILESRRTELLRSSKVQIHCIEADDTDTRSIIAVSEHINRYFEVDMLVNYAETGFDRKLVDYDVFSLERKLSTNYAAGTLYAHQLLPNLLVHGQAHILDLWCSQCPVTAWEEALVVFNMRFSDYLNSELQESGVRVNSFGLSKVVDNEGIIRSESQLAAEAADILHRLFDIVPHVCTEK
ncbi:MAG: SDR family NAD(P)-dependent oxidoreductase [Dyadobacter sp.]|uniref:SDR family NAD(P)-dependent oxidoreductase n=1 Tax=Dyadobacter sp. TaxID=1914288 RepID=UPI003265D367